MVVVVDDVVAVRCKFIVVLLRESCGRVAFLYNAIRKSGDTHTEIDDTE